MVQGQPIDSPNDGPASNMGLGLSLNESDERKDSYIETPFQPGSQATSPFGEESYELAKSERLSESEVSSEYFSVSFSSRCVLKGTVCERSRLMRIRFYGCFDKPLGRYLRDDLFDQVILIFFVEFLGRDAID